MSGQFNINSYRQLPSPNPAESMPEQNTAMAAPAMTPMPTQVVMSPALNPAAPAPMPAPVPMAAPAAAMPPPQPQSMPHYQAPQPSPMTQAPAQQQAPVLAQPQFQPQVQPQYQATPPAPAIVQPMMQAAAPVLAAMPGQVMSEAIEEAPKKKGRFSKKSKSAKQDVPATIASEDTDPAPGIQPKSFIYGMAAGVIVTAAIFKVVGTFY